MAHNRVCSGTGTGTLTGKTSIGTGPGPGPSSRRHSPPAAVSAVIALLCFAAFTSACGGAKLETASALPTTPRSPDGVLVEPATTLPVPRDTSDADRVVMLRPELSEAEVRALLEGFFAALEAESLDALGQLCAPDARVIDQGGGARIIDLFRTRFRQYDFHSLVGVEFWDPRQVRVERVSMDSQSVPLALRGDARIVVPVHVSVLPAPMLPAQVTLVIRRGEQGMRVVGYGERN
jgi:hypothetical protein